LFFTDQRFLKTVFLLPLLFMPLSCTPLQLRDNGDIVSRLRTQQENGAIKVVILPFENGTSEKEMEVLVRRSFYNHFSSKRYHDIELDEIDRALEEIGKTSTKTWRDLTPSALGQLFHTDLVIYGKVMEYNKIFLGLYSQIAMTVQVEMVGCKSGEGLWRKTVTKRSHDGGVPFSLFGLIPSTLRSGFHMKNERTLDLIDRINRELMELIPDPPSPSPSPYFVEIQIASFLDRELAQKALKELQGQGFSPRVETVMIGDRLWHRILLGPYSDLNEAEKTRETLKKDSKFQPIFLHHNAQRKSPGP